MRSLLLLVLIATLTALALGQDGESESATITWRTDLVAARADAVEKGRPLMVVFR